MLTVYKPITETKSLGLIAVNYHKNLEPLLYCILGWVNLYQKFEIEKYTVCGKLILPKKWKDIFLYFFWHN